MDHSTKKQKVGDNNTTYYRTEEVLFNSDTLSKIIPCLPSINLLNLALTCKRFGVSNDDELSLIEKSARIAVQDIATEEQLATLPRYEGESSLADYHYLQLMREPLTFDQLLGEADYVNEDKTSVRSYHPSRWETAFSNNILRAGKHYTAFDFSCSQRDSYFLVGVMRPGKANQTASGFPTSTEFYQHFSRTHVERYNNNNIQSCMYFANNGDCYSSDWNVVESRGSKWEGMESMSMSSYKVSMGMLLDLDEGTLSVFRNGRKLGVMKRGLAGPYCWAVSMLGTETSVTINRGKIPSS